MKAFIVLAVLFVAVSADEFCYNNVVGACKSTDRETAKIQCNATYGAIDKVVGDLQIFVNTHITRSYEYLLMATHYGNYQKNRAGFEKLLRGLSDSKWNDAIELIKYVTKRGGVMDFSNRKDLGEDPKDKSYELYELETLAKSLDIEKKLALDANKIHREATGRNTDYHDPEISHYIEEEFSEKQSGLIRKLTGYITDVGSWAKGADNSLAMYLFDEYLQKQ